MRTLALRTAGGTLVILLGFLLVRFFAPESAAPPTRLTVNPLPVARPPAAAALNTGPAPTGQQNIGQVRLLVLDSQTRRPVINAQLKAQWSTGFPNTLTNSLVTDGNGVGVLQYDPSAEDGWNLVVVALKPGFVPKFVSWAASRGDLLEDMPQEYTTTLERASACGGVVTDQEGQPIPDVQVQVEGRDVFVTTPAEREGVALTHTEVTDAQGKWVCDHLPSRLDSVWLSFSHPNYQGGMVGCSKLATATNLGMTYVSESELLNRTAVFRLQRGLVVAGTIVDAQGHPLGGATVIRSHQSGNPSARCSTDEFGRFHFGDIAQAELRLTARAEGFLETNLVFQPKGRDENLRFTLQPASILRGRVLGEDGNAVVGATVIATGEEFRDVNRDWSSRSDAEGRFQWRSAPSYQTNYQISAPGYKVLDQVLLPDREEQQVILQRKPRSKPWRIAGTVLEKGSGRPVDKFEVWVATTLGPQASPAGSLGLAPELRTTATNGSFSFLAENPYAAPVERLDLEIRSSGYLTATRTIPAPVTNRVWLEVELELAPRLCGTVELTDGRPATDAVVLLTQPSSQKRGYMRLPGQFDLQLSSAPHCDTDHEGRFSLPVGSMTGVLLAAHEDGYALLDLQKSASSPVIQLQPWGIIKGTLRMGTGLALEKLVMVGNDYDQDGGPDPFILALTATTDSEGRFVMQRVPPGDWRIEPHHERIRVRPGETTEITLGGGGVKIVGKVVLKNPIQPFAHGASLIPNNERLPLNVSLNTKWFPIPAPRRDEFESTQGYAAAKNHWFTQQFEFRNSPAGREARRNLRAYTAPMQPDGSFSIEEVLPGTYEMSMSGDPLLLSPLQMSLLGGATSDLLVEPGSAEVAVLDVGIIEVDLNTGSPQK